ncbi:MAG TPA: alpha-glucan family phosphorylase [Roseiflexaceae bacterium]|nr:alpha-glucan family phosphorylase [Roseiflexaceae bacterium]
MSADLLFTPMPARISRLRELAYNLWWSWNYDAQDLYRQIDPELWEQEYHNPVGFLRNVRQNRLEDAAINEEYLRQYDQVMAAFDQYMSTDDTWFKRTYPNATDSTIAYFSAEFGLHESLPIYSGGLGVLAGDHVKEASDLDLPFVAVGFIYPQGYFKQRLDHSGWQEAIYNKLNFADIAASPALTPDGREVVIEVELPGRMIFAKVYCIQIGRVPLFLMDTDIHPNSPQDRELSARLYGGDQEMRVAQEIVLGIGGVRALRQMGINPTVWHMNEGHSAFLVLELARERVKNGMRFEDAMEEIRAHSVFTTHTPVPAGNDAFPLPLIEKYFWQYWSQLGISRDEFMGVALQQQNWGPTFAMTVLALKLSDQHNGVSKLHGAVARDMWHWLYPSKPADEVPIKSITNGVHTGTWLAPEMRRLYDAYLGSDWYGRLDDTELWKRIYEVPDEILWDTHRTLKRQLVLFARERLRQRNARMGIPLQSVDYMLDENAFTIGFARRFATYKRATLLFKDQERLKAILHHPERPMQIIFSGKAHPADDPGKMFIQQVYQMSQQPGFQGKILFLEEYDMCVARYLVHGVDVWLNTPRRPHEASGTSGQKASLNGIPNLSILDGWWPEAYNGKNGWAIGEEREYANQDEQDWNDSQHLYHLLESDVLPSYFERVNGVPQRWLSFSKEAIVTCAPVFSTRRMVKEYAERMYMPAAEAVTR